MTNETKPVNPYADEASRYTDEIQALRSKYETAKQRHAEVNELLQQAQDDVSEILNDKDADVSDVVERLIKAEFKVKVIKHRQVWNPDNSVRALTHLAATVDRAEGFLMAASGFMARTIRNAEVESIAKRLNVNMGKIDRNMITIKMHPQAMDAERLSPTSRLSGLGSLDTVGEVSALSHADRAMERLNRLAVFPFDPVPTA
jgi:flagellar hook-basal body complex protein FliE